MVLGEGVCPFVICKDFLHLCGCLALHCFLEASSVYSSIIETKMVQRLIIKVGLMNMSLLFCQFYYIYETCKHCALCKEKSYV